jgi:hypothetical protein
MDLTEVASRMAALDAAYRSVADRPIDPAELLDTDGLGHRIARELAALGLGDATHSVLRTLLDAYEEGPEPVRVAVRGLFDRYSSFRWAAHLPREPMTAEVFRGNLILLSARDQGADTRDEILWLQALCDEARTAGIDTAPILREVADMSSGIDRYGMGSMRTILVVYGGVPE